jgi:hypothetical protein
MRNYLQKFFKDFEYNESDAQFLLATYDKICAEPKAKELFDGAVRGFEEIEGVSFSKTLLPAAREAGELVGAHQYTADLLIFICLTRHAKKIYEQKNISEEIFHNTMLDLRYKLDECRLVKGIVGTFVAPWFKAFFTADRVGLGRLQFERVPFGEEYEIGGIKLSPDTEIINIHIPRTLTPLTPESCDEALDMAKAYFGDGVTPMVFACGSWMLYPKNEEIFSPSSNLYHFFKRFEIVKSADHKEGYPDLWRLFDTDEQDPDKLPTNTSLRRAYVEYLKRGGKTGGALGVFVR